MKASPPSRETERSVSSEGERGSRRDEGLESPGPSRPAPGPGSGVLQAVANRSAQVHGLSNLQRLANEGVQASRSAGLPRGLGQSLESLSGESLGDVRVHYDSPQPAAVGAHAFTRGSEIHLGPQQERHLPHEAWHAVQQKQGRVRATGSVGGVAMNSSHSLEREADVQGARAARGERSSSWSGSGISSSEGAGSAASGVGSGVGSGTIQRVTRDVSAGTWTSDIKSDGRVVPPGKGYIHISSRAGSWAGKGDDHTWVTVEAVDGTGANTLTYVTDLSHSAVKISHSSSHVIAVSQGRQYEGSTYTITWQGAQDALAKAQDIQAHYDEKWTNPTTSAWEDNPHKDYTYATTGRKMFKRDRYINCARYAAKILRASGAGNGLTRRRAGYMVHTPRGISLGMGRTWKQSGKRKARALGSDMKSGMARGYENFKGLFSSSTPDPTLGPTTLAPPTTAPPQVGLADTNDTTGGILATTEEEHDETGVIDMTDMTNMDELEEEVRPTFGRTISTPL